MESKLPLAEWLQTYQYSVLLSKSQDEEMSLAGALCYGSLFLHRDGLLEGVVYLISPGCDPVMGDNRAKQ